MTKTQERLVDRVAQGAERLCFGKPDVTPKMLRELVTLVRRLDADRTEYRERWLRP